MKLKAFNPGVLFAKLFREPLPQMYSTDYIYSLLQRRQTHLWVIAPPKSGSTWLSTLLDNYLGWTTMAMTDSYDRREQEPSLRLLAQAAPMDRVLWKHQHTRASKSTIELIRRAAILPIIQTRDIHDTVMSCIDHFSNLSTVWPMAYMDDHLWSQLGADSRSRFIVDMMAPWYFNFYAGWFSSTLVRDATAYICRYENLNQDPVGELINICEHFGLVRDRKKAQAAVDRADSQFTRRNQAVVGRGTKLPEELKESLSRMRRYYSNIDFSAVGFPQ